MDSGLTSTPVTPQFDQWLAKAMRYCSLQDRCEKEIRNKLREWQCPKEQCDSIIERLKNEGFYDELRYAKSFFRGKFRINSWGKVKIMAALLQMGINTAIIHEAYSEIDEEEYKETLRDILAKKWKITAGQGIASKNKTAVHAISKGYEASLVWETLNQIFKK